MIETEIDRSWIKITAIVAVGAVLAVLFGYYFNALSADLTAGRLIMTLIALVLWLVLIINQTFMIKSFKLGALIFLVQVLAFWTAIAFGKSVSEFSFFAIILLLACLLIGFFKGREFLANAIKIKFSAASSLMLRWAMTGVTLFLVVYFTGFVDFAQPVIPKNFFTFVLSGSAPIAGKFIPGFSVNNRIDDTLKSFIRSKVEAGASEAEIGKMSDASLAEAGKKFGVVINPQTTVADAVYKIASAKLDDLPNNLKQMALVLIIIVAFASLKSLTFLINWLIILLAGVMYQILLAAHFMHIGAENRSKEIIIVD